MVAIGGSSVQLDRRLSSGRHLIRVCDPSTEEIVGTITHSDETDVRLAVLRAHQALPGWAAKPASCRADVIAAMANRLRMQEDLVASTLEREVGTSLLGSARTEVKLAADRLERLAGVATRTAARADSGTIVLQDPGVVAVITPCQQPLLQLAATVGPALAAGCTVVLKPSTLTPFTGLLFARLLGEGGLPQGVLGTLLGFGSTIGERLSAHPQVDVVAFTGSADVGRRVASSALRAGKRLLLRTGGEASTVVLDNVHVQAAVTRVVRGYIERWRRGRLAPGRLVVPNSLMPLVESLVIAEFQRLDAVGAVSAMIPLATRGQLVATLELLESAVNEGARVVLGGPEVQVPERGYFLPFTVLSNVEPSMDVARYAVNSPLLLILGHDGPTQAISIANETADAPFHEVWSSNEAEAMAVAGGLDVRAVRLNGRPADGDDLSWHPDRDVEPAEFCRRKTVVIGSGPRDTNGTCTTTVPKPASNNTARRSAL
jgi:aldehyde dehydrogenase (NAD+)